MTRVTERSAVILVLAAVGCVLPAVSATSGVRLEPETVAAIAPAETTVSQLVERLGPPLAIAEPGQTLWVPAATGLARRPGKCGIESGGSFAMRSDGWFEAFSEHRPLRKEHRVYYWYNSRTWGLQFILPFVILYECRTNTDELLVLVDDATGHVEGKLLHEAP